MKKMMMFLVAGCLLVCVGAIAIADTEEEESYCSDPSDPCCQAGQSAYDQCIIESEYELSNMCSNLANLEYGNYYSYCVDYANQMMSSNPELFELCMLNPSACADLVNGCLSGWSYYYASVYQSCMNSGLFQIPSNCQAFGNNVYIQCTCTMNGTCQ